ncbi:UDP-N-acetylglucosamine 1-carboxyvinyltransferase [Candidatus Roizmanbacteria bacterium RIFCSPLOWO2_01_FULL_37_12]|uniref:UDP-N-acetylglucosamine 1-carboxyvinyltransferase n=1 Tax=Candidatus Roizmanbacteria bacterium RIFCSPLOWO2_01_FULL_37_12 TaxID=1802056 RepID=A0A1F7IEJ8_9BACT|nr:MAG: UDP-N-acetylglucosamine 1-carboxyvinyltransferase [Candidatus Roizmanbacteria bacterium RIFCSPHIGHO2_02_FULL_37_9b]OGK41786.1 MAG: UDP-N-acetylglucosamine 1-carboxyvinyltransferase [Candidatus Roizmanbacteria bacterium RIFCSPLOWO2_01_FULL_37_12]
MENSFIIKGGKLLKGAITLSGAKNVALKVIIAALLLDQEVTLKNIPRINDVHELLHLIGSLGAKAEFAAEHTVVVDGRTLRLNRVDLLHAAKIRVSFMLFAPLLYKFSLCYVPNPGGCRIGARPIDRIVEGMKKLGITIEYDSDTGYYQAQMKTKPAGFYRFPKITHTGTELLIMLSVFGRDKIILENTALEPEIDELVRFLNLAGAKIQKNGKKIFITPVEKLILNQPFEIITDRNEAITFAVLAVATKGEVTISSITPENIQSFLQKMKEVGAGVEVLGKTLIRFYYKGPLRSSQIHTQPHPGFMTDWQPNWAVLMTQAKGDSLIYERVFENRFSYVEELRKLGADIDFVKVPVINPAEYFFFNFNPNKKYNQAIKIRGPQKLHGGALSIADLRAGATLIIAALIAEGESVVNGVSILERGYENFVQKVTSLGGDIKKI